MLPPIIFPKVESNICNPTPLQDMLVPKAVKVIENVPIFAMLCSNPGKTNVMTIIIIINVLAIYSFSLMPTKAAAHTIKLHRIPLIKSSKPSKLNLLETTFARY